MKHPWLPLVLFFAIGFAIYGPSLHNEFVMDDDDQVVENTIVHSLANIPAFFMGSTLFQGGQGKLAGIYYKPLMTTANAVLWAISGNDPLGFHLFQLVLHILSAWLVVLLFRRFLPPMWAIFGGLLFLCHPYHAETVVYVAALQDTMYMFFGLLALHALARSVPLTWSRSLLYGVLLLAAMLSKESGVLFVLVGVVDTYLFRRALMRRVLCVTGLVSGIYLVLRCYVAHLTSLQHNLTEIGRASALTRGLTAPLVMARYLWKYFVAFPYTTAEDWVVRSPDFIHFGLPLAALVGIAGASFYYGRRRSDFLYMTLWTSIGLGFHSHILVPLDGTATSRWFYFSFIGFTGMILIGLHNFIKARNWPVLTWRGAYALPVLVLIPLSLLSYARAQEWRDGYTLFEAEVRNLPESFIMQNNFGVELFKRGHVDEAETFFRRSVELGPHWTINWNNLGAVYQRRGQLKEAEEAYHHSIVNGVYFLAYENYLGILVAQNRRDEARAFLMEKALPSFPANEHFQEMARALQISLTPPDTTAQ